MNKAQQKIQARKEHEAKNRARYKEFIAEGYKISKEEGDKRQLDEDLWNDPLAEELANRHWPRLFDAA